LVVGEIDDAKIANALALPVPAFVICHVAGAVDDVHVEIDYRVGRVVLVANDLSTDVRVIYALCGFLSLLKESALFNERSVRGWPKAT